MRLLDPDDRAVAVFARRQGRTWAGVIGVLGASSAMILGSTAPTTSIAILLSTWVVAGIAYGVELIAKPKSAGSPRQAATRRPEPQVDSDLVEAEPRAAAQFTRLASLQDLAVGSIAWPLAGLGLLAPLTIHFLILLALIGPGGFDGFGVYATITSVILIPAYATLIARSHNFAERLAFGSNPSQLEQAGLHTLLATAFAALFPGLIVLGAPSLVVAVTGALFIPASFAWAHATMRTERADLEQLEGYLAKAYPDEAFATAHHVALDDKQSAVRRLMALRFIANHYDRHRVGPILDSVLASDQRDLAGYALQASVTVQHRPSLESLTVLAESGRNDVAEAAVRCLVACHGVATEPTLRRLLFAPASAVRIAALKGLGRVGNRDSVAFIHSILGRRDADLPTSAAYAAMSQIKSRLPAAEPGQLSLSPAGDGTLALTSTFATTFSDSDEKNTST